MALTIDLYKELYKGLQEALTKYYMSIPTERKVDDNYETTYHITFNYGNYKKENSKCMATE